MKTIYFDNAATTRVTEPVLQAALPYLSKSYGNPSSTHQMGIEAKQAIETARKQCAKAINAKPEQIFFTSGATESNNLVARQGLILSSPYEHPSMKTGETWTDLKSDLDDFKSRGTKNLVVSQMMVNNELGAVFDVASTAEQAHKRGYKFHTDASQAFGHIRVDVKVIDCDYLSLSGSKIHAPKGVGLLYIKDPKDFCSPIIGGGQEKGIRSGTENVFGIVALGKAMKLYKYTPEKAEYCYKLKCNLISGLAKKCPVEFRINEIEGLKHVNNIANISFRGINGESLQILLSYAGFCVSTGSACHSASLEPSAVIKALGLSKEYQLGTIRVSFSEENTIEEVGAFVDKACEIISTLMKIKN